ncbi:MAG: phosphodiesterase, partial [Corynebacterium sp.]|nr:phosphodiesterase [Corynebacterium sp.]
RLRRDMDVVAAEFIVPSVTAGSAYDAIVPSPVAAPAVKEARRGGQDALTTIAHWYKYVDLTRHGMMVVDVDSTRTQVDWFHGEVLQDDAPMTYTTSWQTRVGDPGARPAAGPLQ